ncbi:MAG: site-specific integrase [Leptolyngbya sp. UWPOB_LEPTO1]|uniref:tyrosine-type recombinase/integrase n=1 Tax=Leptolyngbya sp. UWPOB_LEPTO1 TaxID=2815653 RepID=UPI001ACD8D6E|nr:site-specific integrase [Leptolyngbya sp. UWPOB_LEPTO1]MBN8561055.1 site-specific integrase [Leptolyngbya sp. UWPOB_LEPTO1]
MPKNDRNGQAEIWSEDQFQAVMAELSPKMRAAFSICYYSGCRISEALQLKAEDLISDRIVFRRMTTKTKQTREVKIHPKLAAVLKQADLPKTGFLFPGRGKRGYLTRQAADKALREACEYLGFVGFSTHSNRRTAATKLNNAGVPLRVIQKVGGWSELSALQKYLEVTPNQIDDAILKL